MALQVFVVQPRGHHGYPEPKAGLYEPLVYSSACLRCGVHADQIAPFRVRRSPGAAHSAFVQLNWVFDQFFVRPDVGEQLLVAGLRGFELADIVEHRTGQPLADRRQLVIQTVLHCAETSRLPRVTCKPNNEEGEWELPGPKRYPLDAPYCGSVKFHGATTLAVDPVALVDALDLFQTAEWFGSGGSAYRATLCSSAFVSCVQRAGWRGLQFEPVVLSGVSLRHED